MIFYTLDYSTKCLPANKMNWTRSLSCKQWGLASSVVSHLTWFTWGIAASRTRKMLAILNKFEFEFHFILFAWYRETAPNPIELRPVKQMMSTACHRYFANCQLVTSEAFIQPSWNLTKWLFSNYRPVKIRSLKIAITLLTTIVENHPVFMFMRWRLWCYTVLINTFDRSKVIKKFYFSWMIYCLHLRNFKCLRNLFSSNCENWIITCWLMHLLIRNAGITYKI